MKYEHMTFAEYNGLQSCSDQQQDMFILSCTKGKQNGTYVEVGAGPAIHGNNTFLLESRFGWKGVSVEWDVTLVETFNSIRNNPCISSDARLVDYDELFQKHNLGPHIDYLQLDTDPATITLEVLKKIPFDKYKFSIITFEHDWYRNDGYTRVESRNFLNSLGYTRVVSDVVDGRVGAFEDWYVNEEVIGNDTWKEFSKFGAIVPMTHPDCSIYMRQLLSRLTKF